MSFQTQTAYAVLCQLGHTDKLSTFVYALIWSVWCSWNRTAYAVCVQWILSKMALRWHRVDELLNKVVIFVFFAYKKYSRRFIKLWLNHWWQMDYSDDVFHTFLGLDSVNCLAVNGTVTSLPVFIQNIFKLCSGDEQSFYGFERHGDKWLKTKFSLWGVVPLN